MAGFNCRAEWKQASVQGSPERKVDQNEVVHRKRTRNWQCVQRVLDESKPLSLRLTTGIHAAERMWKEIVDILFGQEEAVGLLRIGDAVDCSTDGGAEFTLRVLAAESVDRDQELHLCVLWMAGKFQHRTLYS